MKIIRGSHICWGLVLPRWLTGGGGAKMDDIRPSHDNISLIVRHCTEINWEIATVFGHIYVCQAGGKNIRYDSSTYELDLILLMFVIFQHAA